MFCRAIVLAAAVIVAQSACLVHGATLFSEDFESYAAGSSLSGQGGWTGDDIRIGDSPILGSRVLDGFQSTEMAGLATLSHPLSRPLDPGEITRFSFQAHTFPFPGTSSGMIGLESLGWNIAFFQVPEWIFQGPTSGERLFASALNTTATLGLVIDGPASQAYGFIDYGQGNVLLTRSLFIDSQLISSIDSVGLSMPPGNGFQVDNLSIEVVPEPSVWLLIVLSSSFLFMRRRKNS